MAKIAATVPLLCCILLLMPGCGGGGGGPKDLSEGQATEIPGFEPLPGGTGSGGGGSGGGGAAGLPYRVLLTGTTSAVSWNMTAVARDPSSWSTLWAQHSPPMPPGVGAPDVAPPSVDFANEIVAAIFLGDRMTGGYTVAILSVMSEGQDGAMVSYAERQPGPTCAVTTAITRPFILIATMRVEGPVSFDGAVTQTTCP